MSSETKYKCDKCKEKIEPYRNMIEGVYQADHVGQDRPRHKLTFVRPPNNLRGSDEPDLCKKCLLEEIVDYLERY
jgi:hypothetical protein